MKVAARCEVARAVRSRARQTGSGGIGKNLNQIEFFFFKQSCKAENLFKNITDCESGGGCYFGLMMHKMQGGGKSLPLESDSIMC